MSVPEVGLIADIGATTARFALVQADGSMTPPRVHALNDYPSISHAIDAYLAEESPPATPIRHHWYFGRSYAISPWPGLYGRTSVLAHTFSGARSARFHWVGEGRIRGGFCTHPWPFWP
jgi:hypothetical protein